MKDQFRPMSSLAITREDLLNTQGLIASIGSPGAGKSTFFDGLRDDRWLRLERDRFREAMFGSRRAFWDHTLDAKIKSEIIRRPMWAALANWPMHRYMLSDTGSKADAITYFIRVMDQKFAKSVSLRRKTDLTKDFLTVHLIVFEQPLEVLIERNKTRPEEHRIDEQLLIDKYDETYGPEAWWREIEKRDARKTRMRLLRPEQIIGDADGRKDV